MTNSFKITCNNCGEEDVLAKDSFDLLKTKKDKFEVCLNVESVKLELECKKCGNKFTGGG